jgi:hypothetical protein
VFDVYLATVFFGADAFPPALAVGVAFGALGAAGFFTALGAAGALAGALVALATAAGALPAVLPPAFGAGAGAGASSTGASTTGAGAGADSASTLYGASVVVEDPLSLKKNHQTAIPAITKPITISIFYLLNIYLLPEYEKHIFYLRN